MIKFRISQEGEQKAQEQNQKQSKRFPPFGQLNSECPYDGVPTATLRLWIDQSAEHGL